MRISDHMCQMWQVQVNFLNQNSPWCVDHNVAQLQRSSTKRGTNNMPKIHQIFPSAIHILCGSQPIWSSAPFLKHCSLPLCFFFPFFFLNSSDFLTYYKLYLLIPCKSLSLKCKFQNKPCSTVIVLSSVLLLASMQACAQMTPVAWITKEKSLHCFLISSQASEVASLNTLTLFPAEERKV